MSKLLSLLLFMILLSFGTFGQDLIAIESYEGYLKKFSESRFSEPGGNSNESYRILIWPTFHSPVLITLEREKSGITIISKTLEGEGGYKVGKIKKQSRTSVKESKLKKFSKLLVDFKIYDMPSRETRFDQRPDGTVEVCLDGAIWYFESNRADGYKLIEKICPEDDGFLRVGFFLVKMSKSGIKRRELF